MTWSMAFHCNCSENVGFELAIVIVRGESDHMIEYMSRKFSERLATEAAQS